MRKFVKKAGVAVATLNGLLLSGLVMAQTAPAAPTTGTALAQSVDLSDAKIAGLIVIGLMVSAGVALWGGRLVLSKFQPKL